MNARDRMGASGGSRLSEVFGRDLEMGPTAADRAATRAHDQALAELSAEQDRLGDRLMAALDRGAKARSYATDPRSDPGLAALLLRRVARDRRELAARLESLRARTETIAVATEPKGTGRIN